METFQYYVKSQDRPQHRHRPQFGQLFGGPNDATDLNSANFSVTSTDPNSAIHNDLSRGMDVVGVVALNSDSKT